MASQAWKVVKKHVPLIKFRKGGPSNKSVSGDSSSGPSAPAGRATSGPTIEFYQLPKRYQRRPLDQFEIDYINRGGPD